MDILSFAAFCAYTVIILSSATVKGQNFGGNTSPYTYVDLGQCLDESGKKYNYFRKYTSTDAPEECGAWCSNPMTQGGQSEFHVGFSYVSSNGQCNCLYTLRGLPDEPSDSTYINDAQGGEGEISDTSTNENFACYKYNNFGKSTSEIPDVDIGYIDANITASSNSSFTFSCTNSITGFVVFAAVVASTQCTGENSSFEINEDADTSKLVSDIYSGTSVATLMKNFQDELNITRMNSGFDSLNYCIRCDLYQDGKPDFSVMARKFDLLLDITFERNATFNVDSILTSEFISSVASASASRSVSIEVFKGTCDSNPTCNVNTNDCFSGVNEVVVGDTLDLCIMASDADVKVGGLESATAEAGDNYQSILIAKSGTDGEVGTPNFVTRSIVNESGELTLSTLLLPAYFDALAGSGIERVITVSGVVLLEYVLELDSGSRHRRLKTDSDSNERVLQISEVENSAFSASIPLGVGDVPTIAQTGTSSVGRSALGSAMAATATAIFVGMLVLF
mmetsp:Transcript_13959/g.28432  ORF Transcript_13959/g.28432 Transcript_13959/m.28432 type:complete len:508 (+) Transcript_13959:178-1701(+)